MLRNFPVNYMLLEISYPIRTSIAILDWNEKNYKYEILKRINSTQEPSLVMVNSIEKEHIEKIKAKKKDKVQKNWLNNIKKKEEEKRTNKFLQANLLIKTKQSISVFLKITFGMRISDLIV